jgi:hypothetical protein
MEILELKKTIVKIKVLLRHSTAKGDDRGKNP